MIGVAAFIGAALGELGALGANPFRAGEETRAKDAKDAKVKGMRAITDLSVSLYRCGPLRCATKTDTETSVSQGSNPILTTEVF